MKPLMYVFHISFRGRDQTHAFLFLFSSISSFIIIFFIQHSNVYLPIRWNRSRRTGSQSVHELLHQNAISHFLHDCSAASVHTKVFIIMFTLNFIIVFITFGIAIIIVVTLPLTSTMALVKKTTVLHIPLPHPSFYHFCLPPFPCQNQSPMLR